MEVLVSSTAASTRPHFILSNPKKPLTLTFKPSIISQVNPWKFIEGRLLSGISCIRTNVYWSGICGSSDALCKHEFLIHPLCRLNKTFSSQSSCFAISHGCSHRLRKHTSSLQKVMSHSDKIRRHASVVFVRLVAAMLLVTSVSVAPSNTPSWALSEENLLFLEAWRTIDRAYIDKTFNGQSWFRYRENALRNEPMNNREETYMAIKKMLASLDDPFTRFLEPEKFKSLRSGTQGALTGIGLSIGYPKGSEGSQAGLVVISAAPGGPAYQAGILSGDIILEIDNTSTESMSIYDAAERLQREKVSLNPVKSRLCEIPGSEKNYPRIGYIKLTSFNQKASAAVKEAIDTLRSNRANAFVLDLRDNSGGLFPEGIETAKIWLDKGVIVYICDNHGVRDIYDTDGGPAIAVSEPLAVLVNKGTASASEILAGALKDNKRAVLFGEPTYGKGKIQSVFQLSDGSGLAVTVARYETPAHIDIDKIGVIPDHPLPNPFPEDEDAFCGCIQDSGSACYVNNVQLFSR
ncbi:carboxyl-terminal-processing peptidase 2, chloroplastic-like isoform X2 [Herrania umbratica]|uniref:C-terminal processing peptidase n=1 Tax=Herrania umbratica TaxID=108875 RepID=A0A6J1AW00_9ROSI|nr:carboxyl-terminal-processing peptidase 2, chloroplastic-like isoform X2 [Herrania umbratica]